MFTKRTLRTPMQLPHTTSEVTASEASVMLALFASEVFESATPGTQSADGEQDEFEETDNPAVVHQVRLTELAFYAKERRP
jgi:hypothetical protein